MKEDRICKQEKKYDVISLFSGCGGLDLGIEGGFSFLKKKYPRNPFNVIWANDINNKAVETHKLNFPNSKVICEDITKILDISNENTEQLHLYRGNIQLPNADIIIGGFPCQDFSLAGKRQGLQVQRGNLYKCMVKAVELVKPKIFVAENVKGLISWKNGAAIRTIIEDFSKLGYNVDYRLFNAADFGVPQNRERVIIIGLRNDLDMQLEWMEPKHNNKNWVSIKQAIEDLENDDFHNSLPNSGYSKAKLFPGTQGNIKTNPNKPAPTMRAEHHGNIEFHYSLPRRLSAREAARIQTFPDDFCFVNSTTDAYRQVGNAVPPVFAWHIAKMLESALSSIKGIEVAQYA